jgi:hypothetical protein
MNSAREPDRQNGDLQARHQLLNRLRRIKAPENAGRQGEPKPHPDRLTVQPSAYLRVLKFPQQRIAVVGNGNIDVGNESPTRKPGKPTVSGSIGSSELRIDPSLKTGREGTSSGLCGAMSQQGGEFRGNISAPQKFLHLVGCRDRNVSQVPETSQYSNRVKRP